MPDVQTRRWWVATGLAMALLAPVPMAFAQETAPAQQEAAATEAAEEAEAEMAEGSGVIEEITVTAQKREENVQEVPLAISTLDMEALEVLTTGGVDVRFLSARVPSVILESSFGRSFPRFYVRGLGNTDFDLNASQPVSMVYDEIVLENAVLKGMPLFDVERAEVLRGPQGTLFGRNTPAGIVKFDTVKPSQENDAEVRASYGSFDTLDLRGAWGGGLTDSLSMRVSALVQSRSDWVENRAPGGEDLEGYDTWAGRLQLLFEPNDRFSGLLNVHAWNVDGTARVFRANIIKPGTDDLVSGFDREEVTQDGENVQDIESEGLVLKLDYDFDGATLTSVTGYDTLEMFSRGDIDGGFGAAFLPGGSTPGFIPFSAESADGLPDLDQLTQEIRLTSNGDGRLGWLVGAYYFDESVSIDTFNFDSLLPGNPQNGYAFQTQDNESWAVFGSVDYRISDSWKLQAGLRQTHDEKDFAAERPQPLFQSPTSAPIRRNTDADMTSWDVSATYFANENVNFYGRVATSFRAPSIQGRILFCPDFEGGTNPATNCVSVAEEEEALSTEIGMKSELLDQRLRLNLTAYRYVVDGQQIVAVGGQFNTATLLNADETEGYGFEADVQFAPASAWLVSLGLSNNHTEIQDPNLVVATCGGGCTILDPLNPAGLARVDGNSLPHAPEWIASAIVDYRRPIGTNILAGSVDFAWHDEKRFFLYESAEFQDDSLELGARLAWLFADARYEIAAYGRNLTDDISVQGGIDFNNLTGMVNEPRTFGLEMVARF
jgi:iron complex outermembrane receptor protein